MKELKIELVKTSGGYQISNADAQSIDVFEDTDEGRKEFVRFLVNNVLNLEVEGGRKYE